MNNNMKYVEIKTLDPETGNILSGVDERNGYKMKKILTLALTIILSISLLAACHGGESQSENNGGSDNGRMVEEEQELTTVEEPEDAETDEDGEEISQLDSDIIVQGIYSVLIELIKRSFGYPVDWGAIDAGAAVETLLGGEREYLQTVEYFQRFDETPEDLKQTVFRKIFSEILVKDDITNHENLNTLNIERANLHIRSDIYYMFYDFDSSLSVEALRTFYSYSQMVFVSDYWYRDFSGNISYYEFDLSQIINNDPELLVNATWSYTSKLTLHEGGTLQSISGNTSGMGAATFPFVFRNQNTDGFSETVVADILNSDDDYTKVVYDCIVELYSNSRGVTKTNASLGVVELQVEKDLVPVEGYSFEIDWYDE